MPSRPVTIAIVLFWLGATTWWFLRDVLPRLESGDAPPVVLDLTDEFGSHLVTWNLHDGSPYGKPIGMGNTRVRRLADRTFELKSDFRFQSLKLYALAKVKSTNNLYRVTQEGHLLELSAQVVLEDLTGLGSLAVEIQGKVTDGKLRPQLLVGGVEQKFLGLPEVNVANTGSVINPMHLVNRLGGLRAGQQFKIPLIDPLGASLPGNKLSLPQLDATVFSETLTWHNQQVDCYRIDYQPHDEKVVARTWARRVDGLVLQQQAMHHGLNLVLVREKEQ